MSGVALSKTLRVIVLAIGAVGASSAALAIALPSGGGGTVRAHKLGGEAIQSTAAGLIARLAVLRRSQTQADLLPANVSVAGLTGSSSRVWRGWLHPPQERAFVWLSARR